MQLKVVSQPISLSGIGLVTGGLLDQFLRQINKDMREEGPVHPGLSRGNSL